MRFLNVLLIFLLFLTYPATAQINYSPIPAAPSANAMNLGIFGQIPVSHHTGVPDINIPVYTVNAGKISLPVSLNYHAGGVKIEVHPSWVGLGWSLNAGGVITRIQKGIRDDINDPNPGNVAERGYYFTYNRNNRLDWSSNGYLSTYPGSQGYDFKSDAEPDEFVFSYPGNSGKFFLSEYRTWQVQSDKPCRVDFEPQDFTNPFGTNDGWYNSTWAFKKFTIVDEFGNRYIYGNQASSIEYSEAFAQNLNDVTATSWFLTKIISADGVDIIELNYDRGPLTSQLYAQLYRKSIYINGGSSLGCGSYTTSWSAGGITQAQRGNVVSPVYLRSIRYPRKNIKLEFFTSKSNELTHPDFVYDDLCKGLYKQMTGTINDPPVIAPGGMFSMSGVIYNTIPYWQNNPYPPTYWARLVWLKLDRIEIKDESTNTKLKSIWLDYNNATNERLRLWKVNYKNANDAQVSKYELVYNTQTLPPYLFGSVGDHWGFVNGGLSIVDVVSSGAFSTHYNWRQPNPSFAQSGILTEMIYPTGGKTKFEYELNTYSKHIHPLQRTNVQNENGFAGGLRIKKIINVDGTKEESKEYYYVTGYTAGANPGSLTSSGVLDTKPYYEQNNVILFDGSSNSINYNVFSSSPVIPLTPNSKGQHIGYSEVVEKRSDGAFTIFTYTNHDNGFPDASFVNSINGFFQFNVPPCSRDFERGRPLEKRIYNNAGILVSKEISEYERIGDPAVWGTRAIKVGLEGWCTIPPMTGYDLPDQFGYFYRTAYLQYYYSFVLKKNTSIVYDETNPARSIETVTEYTYSNKLPGTITVTNSTGDRIRTENTYSFAYPLHIIYGVMHDKNMLNYIVKTDQYYNGTLVKRVTNDYKEWDNGEFYPERTQTQIANNPLETEMQANNYDEQGNLLQATGRNGIIESYDWGYNKTYPITKVVNAQNTFVNRYQKVQRAQNLNIVPANATVNFTTGYYGSVTLELKANASNTNTPFYVRGTLTGPETRPFELCRLSCNTSGIPASLTFQDLPPGSYTINIQFRTVEVPPHCSGCPDPDIYIRYSFLEKQFLNTQGVKEFLYEDFEETGGWDNGFSFLDNTRSHTGKYSGSIYKPTAGEQVCASVPWLNVSLATPVKYRFSGWIYSNGPSAELFLLMKRAGETGYTTYYDNVGTSVTNQWVYIEKEYTVPADVTQMTMRVDNNGGGTVWFDDIRLHPSAAQMTTFTYDYATGMTSQTDMNNRTIYYEYDEAQRLKLIRDQDGNIIRIFKYQYKQ